MSSPAIDLYPMPNNPADCDLYPIADNESEVESENGSSEPATSPSVDKLEVDKPQVAALRGIYDYIPLPIGICTLGIAPKLVDAADMYLVDPFVKSLVSGAKKNLIPVVNSLDQKYTASDAKKDAKALKEAKALKKKAKKSARATSTDPHLTEAQCEQQLLFCSRRGSKEEPDAEPDYLCRSDRPRNSGTSQPMMTPRGELLRPRINYMELAGAGCGPTPSCGSSAPKSFCEGEETNNSTSIGIANSSLPFPSGVSTSSYSNAASQLSSPSEGPSDLSTAASRGLGMDLSRDRYAARQAMKQALLDEASYQPLYARDNKGWEFPLARTEVNERLSTKLTFENEGLKEKLEAQKMRLNIGDRRADVRDLYKTLRDGPLRRSIQAHESNSPPF